MLRAMGKKPRNAGRGRLPSGSLVRQWKDSELHDYHDHWERRGELLVSVGGTSTFVWLAAALPSEHSTHVDIWPPIAVSLVVVLAGIYVIMAAETERGWLPGRQRIRDTSRGRAMVDMMDRLHEQTEKKEAVIVQLVKGDDNARPFPPPLDYQVTMLKQVLPLLSAIGCTEVQVSWLSRAFALATRSGKNPLLEPLWGEDCLDGLQQLAGEGVIEMAYPPSGFRIISTEPA